MNSVLVLSGGTGTRLCAAVPKQYQVIAGKPILVHTLAQIQKCDSVDCVAVVASPAWKTQILYWKKEFVLTKLVAVAPAGENRQTSIRSGLAALRAFMDMDELSGVIVQDAVRPLTSLELLNRLVQELLEAPCVMPVLPVTDTTYTSCDGQWVDGLLERSALYGGQAPEAFRYWPYLQLYEEASAGELSTMSGSCQLPYKRGWRVKMIPGEQENIKITYPLDLKVCEILLRERGEIS